MNHIALLPYNIKQFMSWNAGGRQTVDPEAGHKKRNKLKNSALLAGKLQKLHKPNRKLGL